jgi:hypothetical protein
MDADIGMFQLFATCILAAGVLVVRAFQRAVA